MSNWDTENLKEYFEKVLDEHELRYSQRFESSTVAVNAALAAAKEAVIKAENATEKRFASVNEFRNTLSDQQRTLMPRTEVELLNKGLNDRIVILENISTQDAGKDKGQQVLWGYVVGIIGITIAILTFIFKH